MSSPDEEAEGARIKLYRIPQETPRTDCGRKLVGSSDSNNPTSAYSQLAFLSFLELGNVCDMRCYCYCLCNAMNTSDRL